MLIYTRAGGFYSTKGLILLAEGRRQDFLQVLTNQTSPGLQLNRIVCVSDNEALDEAIKRRLGEFGYLPRVLPYSSLGTINVRSARGKSIILVSPSATINDSPAKGMVDGGLVRLLSSRIWMDALAFREADADLSLIPVRGVEELARWVAQGIDAVPKA